MPTRKMMMAHPCRIGIKNECDSCGYCEKEQEECPRCQETQYEYLYKRDDGEIVGCSECIERMWSD